MRTIELAQKRPQPSIANLADAVKAAMERGLRDYQNREASLKDAKLRRIVEKYHGPVVADGLAGIALEELAKKCEAEQPEGTIAANAGNDDGGDFATPID